MLNEPTSVWSLSLLLFALCFLDQLDIWLRNKSLNINNTRLALSLDHSIDNTANKREQRNKQSNKPSLFI